jgi:uncharacterized protein Yka (UPF0111/DUF47 family)
MFSIQKLFARDDKLFALLAASAEESRASVQALKQVLSGDRLTASLAAFEASRRKENQITTQIGELIARTSVTVLDREDIESISSVLYKIPKTVEKFAEHYLISADHLQGVSFFRQITFLEQATDTVVAMIRELEKSHFPQVKAQNESLQKIEGEADDLMINLLKELYSGKYPPITVVILKDLYELLEKVVDRCRDVGNVVANVVLKHT